MGGGPPKKKANLISTTEEPIMPEDEEASPKPSGPKPGKVIFLKEVNNKFVFKV